MGTREQPLVLLLDDDEVWARSLTRGLGRRGLTLISEVNIESAHAAVLRERPDLCLIDYSLSRGENGAEFARQLWEAHGKRTPPLVLMSGTLSDVPAEDRRPFVAAYEKTLGLDEIEQELRMTLRDGNQISRSHSRLRPIPASQASINEALHRRKKRHTP